VSTAAVTAALLGGCVFVSPGSAQAQAAAPPAVAVPAPSGAPPEAAPHNQQKKDGHWQLSRFPINQNNPESKIPTEAERSQEPLDFGYFLQDLASEGAYAEKKGDYASAVKYWRALAKAVPDVATGFRRACRAYEALKDRRNGLDYCGSTLNMPGAELEDYVHYGNMMLMKTTPLDAAELSDFENSIKHLRSQGGDGPLFIAETLTCELGVAQEDVKRLESCTQTIEKLKPNEPQTLSFQWSLAMFRHDYVGARELVGRLQTTTYKPELVARMAAATQAEARWWKPFLTDWRYQLGTLVALLLGAFALFSRRKSALPPAPQSTAPGVS
jgi:tetratricopeptide (TPR) repeat protein